MLAFIVLFCFRVSVGGKFSGVVQIINIFLLANFCGFYLVVWLGGFCVIFTGATLKSLMKALLLRALWDRVLGFL